MISAAGLARIRQIGNKVPEPKRGRIAHPVP